MTGILWLAHFLSALSVILSFGQGRLNSLAADKFIERWRRSGAKGRANYALFLSYAPMDVPRPGRAAQDDSLDHYVFERPVIFRHPTGLTSTGFIDLYKRGCFVLEAKNGADTLWDLFSPPRFRRGWDGFHPQAVCAIFGAQLQRHSCLSFLRA
jgi:hypothetical protein